MVQSTRDDGSNYRFVIRPNRSATWKQSWQLFVLMVVVTGGIAIAFAVRGYWPVLPFAGLELGVLAVCLHLVTRSGQHTEVVKVQGARVAVEKGRRGPSRSWEFQRAWVRVALEPSGHRWYPSRLVIRSHGREVSLGAFLSEEERARLARDLDRAIAMQ